MTKEPILFCWSGGKDSAMALHEIRSSGLYDVVALLTTVSEEHDRICMHGVRRSLLVDQAGAVGVPLHEIRLASSPTNAEYEAKMEAALTSYRRQGVTKVGFGDIFLEDLKAYRDRNLAKLEMSGVYPIWKRQSAELIGSFIRAGFKAVLSCVDTTALAPTFAGRLIDDSFVGDLPKSVDPCGENGEFHSFVFDGPIFSRRIAFSLGETRDTGRFFYRDLVPAEDSRS